MIESAEFMVNARVTRQLMISIFRALSRAQSIQRIINLTCDAWQASNTDGYFAVTGHWIEEASPGVWTLESALLGFVRLNNSHNGMRLGQALFKVVRCVGIENKVCLSALVSICLACNYR